MNKQKLLEWLKAAGTRAIRTAAQTAVATIGTTGMIMTDINWPVVGSASLLAAILSMLMALAGLPELDK